MVTLDRCVMRKIEEIDKNFKVETKLDKSDIKFYSVLEPPFCVHGVTYEDGKFYRMPQEIAKSVNEWVWHLSSNTAGGRVRFKTDSSYIAICAMDHFALTGIPNNFEKFIEIPITISNTNDPYGYGGADGLMMRDFIKCIIKDTDPPIDIEMGIKMSLSGIIANKSAERGGQLLEIPQIF